MAIEKVKAYFREYGMEDRVLELDESSATVELAAQALHCEPARIAKTLSFLVDGRAVLVVAAGDAKIDNGKYKAQFAAKAKMLTPQEAEELVGHAVGGVCPFAVNPGVSVSMIQQVHATIAMTIRSPVNPTAPSTKSPALKGKKPNMVPAYHKTMYTTMIHTAFLSVSFIAALLCKSNQRTA